MTAFKPMPLSRKEVIRVLTDIDTLDLLPDELLVDIGHYLKLDSFTLTDKELITDMIWIRTDEIEGDAYKNHDYTFLEEYLTYVSCEFLFLKPEIIRELRKCLIRRQQIYDYHFGNK